MLRINPQESNESKLEDEKIRTFRMEKLKQLKQQQEIFSKIIQTRIDYTSKYIHKLISKGIPSRYRSSIWPQLMKNRHGITPQFYSMLVKKAVFFKQHNMIQPFDESSKILTMKLIKQDIPRTFTQIKLFRQNTQLSFILEELLQAWVIYRQDIGYIQGMSQIAGFLLTQLKDHQSFNVFSSIITTPVLVNFYTFNLKEIEKFEKKYQHVFRINNQQLFDTFKQNEITTRIYLFQWIITLFTKCFEFQVLGRLWDMLLLYECNPNFLIEVAYAIVFVKSKQLNKIEGEQILRYLKTIKIKQYEEIELFEHLNLYQSY